MLKGQYAVRGIGALQCIAEISVTTGQRTAQQPFWQALAEPAHHDDRFIAGRPVDFRLSPTNELHD